jgi:hypothetical protein
MKVFGCSLGLSLLFFLLGACASAPKARTPDETFAAMARALSHTVDQERGFEPGEAVGTTTVTNAALPTGVVDAPLEPMPLPEDRMPLLEAPPVTDGDPHVSSRF